MAVAAWAGDAGGLPGCLAARDLVAGLVLTAVLVPVGMGYAEAAGLPPITACTRRSCRCRYAVLGPSRILVLGPDSSLAAIIAATRRPAVAAGDPEGAVALAGGLALIRGRCGSPSGCSVSGS